MQLPGAAALVRTFSALTGMSGNGILATRVPSPPQVGYPSPLPTHPGRDQVVQDVYPQPWRGPLDMANYGGETEEMRYAYRRAYLEEPTVRSAIDGKAARVAILDVSVLPEDEDHPVDNAAAEFVDWTVNKSKTGWDGIILNTLKPAEIDGYSLSEITLNVVTDSRKWRGMWGLEHVRNLDTNYMRLQLDVYRNVTGVINLIRGIQDYNPDKLILFSNSDLFNNPFGYSPLRAAYRAAALIADAYKMWNIALRNYSEPYAVGKTAAQNRVQMEKALRDLRGSGWAVTPLEDSIELLNLASATSLDAFEKKIRLLREDIFLAVCGAYTPFMQGAAKGDTRNDSKTSKTAGSDPLEELLAKCVGRMLTHQLVPRLVRPGENFPQGVGMPRVVLGGVDWKELGDRLKIITDGKAAGFSVSKAWGQGVLHLQPAKDPLDELKAAQPAMPGAPGQPPAGGPAPAGAAPGEKPDAGNPAAPPKQLPGPSEALKDPAVKGPMTPNEEQISGHAPPTQAKEPLDIDKMVREAISSWKP